jgi:ribonuclease HI
VLISPDKKQYLVFVKLQFGCTNNINEYEACILGFRGYIELNIRKIDVYGDSMLIICQVKRRMANQGREVKALQRILV